MIFRVFYNIDGITHPFSYRNSAVKVSFLNFNSRKKWAIFGGLLYTILSFAWSNPLCQLLQTVSKDASRTVCNIFDEQRFINFIQRVLRALPILSVYCIEHLPRNHIYRLFLPNCFFEALFCRLSDLRPIRSCHDCLPFQISAFSAKIKFLSFLYPLPSFAILLTSL